MAENVLPPNCKILTSRTKPWSSLGQETVSVEPTAAARAPRTLTPSRGPRPITVCPGPTGTGGPPSRGCRKKSKDMEVRTGSLARKCLAATSVRHTRHVPEGCETRGSFTGEGASSLSETTTPRGPVTPAGIPRQLTAKLLLKSWGSHPQLHGPSSHRTLGMLGLVVPDTSLPHRSGAQASLKNYQPQKVTRASLRLCRFELWDEGLD